MDTEQILSDISTADAVLARHLAQLPKARKKTAKALLESLSRLAHVLLATGNRVQAERLADAFSGIPFANNYDYWTWIESAVILKGCLAREAGDEEAWQRALNTATQALGSGTQLQVTVKAAVQQRFLEGQTLDTRFAQQADDRDAFVLRLNYFMALLRIRFFGGSEAWPVLALDEEIQQLTAEIRQQVNEHGLYELAPFKN